MAGKPISLLDQHPMPKQLRRDQRKRILEIVSAEGNQPLLALHRVREYIKNCSASEMISLTRFTDRNGSLLEDSASDPFAISCFTHGFGSESVEALGSAYHYRLRQEKTHEAPTLN